MRHKSILCGTVLLALLCSIRLGAQQSDSSGSDNANLLASSQPAGGTFPRLIKFSGGLRDLTGKVPTGVVGLTFALYELPEGGSPLWAETQSLPLDSLGRYTALLGASSPGGLPLDLFTSGKALWLGVQPQLQGQGEQPRILLVAVPYALKASDSDTLGGKPASAYALAGSQTLVGVASGNAPSSASPTTVQPGSQAAPAAGITSSPQNSCTAVTSDGAATANTVAKFTTACNVENSLIRDNGTGVAVGGTSAPGALLDVQYTSTATSGSLLGHRVLSTFNPAATSSASNIGAISAAMTAAGNTQNFTGYLTAMDFTVNHYGKGTLAAEYGMIGYAVNSAAGTISKAVGAYTSLENVSTGTITDGYGMYVNAPVNSGGGKFSNYTGLYIANPSAVTGAYGLYSAGGMNYFGGNVGIGTMTPGANLEVNGTGKFDGLVSFASGQTFPGAGTITGVTAGTGLTGGGTGGNVSVSIPSAGVSDTMLASAYSGTGTCTGSYVSALSRNAGPSCTSLPTATTSTAGIVELAGDVGGSAGSVKVTGLQGVPVSSSAPTTSQVLTYNGSNWAPAGGANIYGDGSSGALSITSSSSWVTSPPSSTLQFTTFSVPSGVTLTVPSGTIIHAMGAVSIAGQIMVATNSSYVGNGQGIGSSLAQVDSSGASVGGGGAINAMFATVLVNPGAQGGGSGLFDNNGTIAPEGNGGGTIVIVAGGAITVSGSIHADGTPGTTATNSSQAGGGGGGGGVIILASKTSLDNTGTLSAVGGAGAPGSSGAGISGSGGGGGGVINLLSPSNAAGTLTVAGGAAGSTNGVTAGFGGGGGGSGGAGGQSGASSAPTAGSTGQTFSQTIADPTTLFAVALHLY